MTTRRLFIAVDPGRPASDRLSAECAALRSTAWRFIPADHFHVTLLFLGNVDEARIPALSDRLADVARRARSFALGFRGLGAFPSLERPRVLWAGVGEGAEALAELAQQVRLALPRHLFPGMDLKRPFVAHLTLARARPSPGPDPDWLERVTASREREYGTTRADELVLYCSRHGGSAPIYAVLERFPLG